MVPGDASSVVSVNPAKPLISVCIPMYNNGATIERCLRSILEQEGVEFEIVVVDDDSSDDCAAIAATMLRPGDRLLRNEPRLGLNRNHNKCLEVARGGLIQFVHGDDRLLPGALQTLSRRFEDPSVGMAFAPRRVESDDIKWQQRYGRVHTRFRKLRDRNHGPSLVLQMVLHGAKENWIGEPTAVMFRRQLALDAGGFRTDIYQLVDVDFWLRLMLRSAVCFVPHELSVRRHTAATETHTGDGDSAQRAGPTAHSHLVDRGPVVAQQRSQRRGAVVDTRMAGHDRGGGRARTAAADALEGFGAGPIPRVRPRPASTADG